MNESQAILAKLVAKRFVQRRDLKAKQSADGAYRPIRHRFTGRDVGIHLAGKATYGHYVVDLEGFCRVLAFDIDFDKAFTWRDQELNPREIFGTDHPARTALNREIRQLADGLAFRLKRHYPHLIVSTAFSGSKGIHVYGSFPSVTSAAVAREIAIDILNSYGCFVLHQGKNFYKHEYLAQAITLEIYPKQESVGDGFGNLLRLPLGVNQKTQRRGFFYDPRSEIDELRPADSLNALEFGLVI